ncbi:Eukaryotic translation initiation factor 4E [Paragonimus heterotremus]|uniref:Eukaryotic translation initiation factor 4E n=1 Tax=Paragonimus heterotremus TaxID=100268 RepID=A0A8J4WEG4_9TREM|nr:Eukaryotic translation initiation factor 4E [Paragonimus heterotremus]
MLSVSRLRTGSCSLTMTTAVGEQCQEAKTEEAPIDLHCLQDPWTYYLFVYKANGSWNDCINKVATFSTVEHFWSVMLHSDPPSRIMNGTDVYMFRGDIEPRWEDPRNESGGRWILNLTQNSPIDTYWEELLMLLVGCDWDTDGEAEQICGAVFQPRSRGHKMAVWISKGDDEETIIQIGRKIKERLHFPDKIYFHTVEDQKALVRGKDITTGRYVL